MKQKIVVLALCLIILLNSASESASASVVINQVLYDPVKTESGGEAIELYNNGNFDIDISGWVIATEASQKDAELPKNTILCAGCYYLIADKGWSASRDNMSWPEADLEETLTMYNSDSGIALIMNSTTIDALGWGNPDEIMEGLYDGEPAYPAKSGMSLLRLRSTGSNRLDFEESVPFFRSSSDIGTGTDSANVSIEFEVSNHSSEPEEESYGIVWVNLSSSNISPVPGGYAEITVNALISGSSANATAALMGAAKAMSITKEVNSTSSIFSAKFGIAYHEPPGEYIINVESGSDSMEIRFEYLSIVAIELSSQSIDFGRIDSGMETSGEIIVRNIGNTEVDLGINGKGFDGFGIENIRYMVNGKEYSLSANTAIRNIGLQPGKSSEASVGIMIIAPENSRTGSYLGNIGITAVAKK